MIILRVILCLALLFLTGRAYAACESLTYKTADYTVCQFDSKSDDIRLFHKDRDGAILGTFGALKSAVEEQGRSLSFAMNAGMYHKDRSPVGLYIEHGIQTQHLMTRASNDNFGMLPNGVFVFWAEDGYQGVHILSATDYQDNMEKTVVQYATQSGPMLVIENKLHPKFQVGSSSLRIRNGVGIDAQGKVYFVKSEDPVNFHSFASLFKDELKTPNALYLDGTVSKLYAPELGRNDRGLMMGPIVAVVGE